MSFKKGKRTIKKLSTADDKFTLLIDEVLNHIDIGVYESSRTTTKQKRMFKNKRSQIDGVKRKSKHQVTLKNPKSKAIDCFPYEKGHNCFDGSDKSELMFYRMYWHFMRASKKLNIPIRWGGLWSFKDYPHFELI